VGLAEAMEWQSTEFEKRSGIKVSFSSSGPAIAVPVNISIGLFRIYQESLTNVARHAEATEVKSSLTLKDHELALRIIDNGKGFDPGSISHKKTLGLLGMKERTVMMGGSYTIQSHPGSGTTVTINVPV
jgi:signal transduction histidine kinase